MDKLGSDGLFLLYVVSSDTLLMWLVIFVHRLLQLKTNRELEFYLPEWIFFFLLDSWGCSDHPSAARNVIGTEIFLGTQICRSWAGVYMKMTYWQHTLILRVQSFRIWKCQGFTMVSTLTDPELQLPPHRSIVKCFPLFGLLLLITRPQGRGSPKWQAHLSRILSSFRSQPAIFLLPQ
jgi:hypothetical protein